MPKPLDFTKPLQTRDGKKVRIYATNGQSARPIHGATLDEEGWRSHSWLPDGAFVGTMTPYPLDLVQARPEFRQEGWVNVYSPQRLMFYATRRAADNGAAPYRFACVSFTLVCHEGDGLPGDPGDSQ